MRTKLSRLSIPLGIGVFVMIACGFSSALAHEPVSAQAATNSCNILMVIDRSGSVGQDANNLPTMKGQIDNLYSPVSGLANPTIKLKEGLTINLGFWSFSSAIAATSATNYDAPYMGYGDVSKPASLNAFDTAFSQVQAGGGTDYEQAFGYNGYAYGTQAMNSNADIQRLIKGVDVLIFLTDGVPNTPSDLSGNGDENNPGAITAAKTAYGAMVAQRPGLNKYTYGFMVSPGAGEPATQADSSALDYILNGYGTPAAISSATGKGKIYNAGHNPSNIKYITSDYSNLESTVEPIMRSTCEQKNNITAGDSYSLNPTVISNNVIAAGSATATFTYNVHSTLPSGSDTDNSSSWKVEKLVVPKGQTTSKLLFGQNPNCGYSADSSKNVPYCDGIAGCDQLNPLIGGTSGGRSCNDIASGTTAFPHGDTSLNQYAGNAVTATIDDSYPIGTKLCYILVVHKPTQNASPLDRASQAACLTVGKQPSVQIHGGDLRVGQAFVGDAASSDSDMTTQPSPAEIDTSVTSKSNGNTYGSWGEYAAIAPGAINGFGSMSGLAGGYPTSQPDSQQFWSKLTFANVENQYGFFTPANNGQGAIPDYASTILASRSVVTDLTATDNLTLKSGTNSSGVYKKTSGDITVNASSLGKNESVILDVPNGTVTIAGNIAYDDGPYDSISEIPQLIIIAKTININPSVVNVDAWLVANSASDGTVSTCDDPATLTINVCNQQLTVNGPILARHISLRRTAGSGTDDASADPAEIINLPGSSYLWSQTEGQSSVRVQTTFTTELPPYF